MRLRSEMPIAAVIGRDSSPEVPIHERESLGILRVPKTIHPPPNNDDTIVVAEHPTLARGEIDQDLATHTNTNTNTNTAETDTHDTPRDLSEIDHHFDPPTEEEERPTLARDSFNRISDQLERLPSLSLATISARVSAGFPAPQFSAPRQPQPFNVPEAPRTRRMVDKDNPDSASFPSVAPPIHRRPYQSQNDLPQGLQIPALPPIPSLTDAQHAELAATSRRSPTTSFPPPAYVSSIAPVAMSASRWARWGAGGGIGPLSFERTIQMRQPRRVSAIAAAAAAIFVSAIIVGIVAFSPSAVAKGRSGASALIDRLRGKPAATSSNEGSAAAAQPTPVPVPMPAIPASAAPSASVVPPVVVDPSTPADHDVTLVTFPAASKGQRIYVDNRQIQTSGSEPTKMKCGQRLVKIGSNGKSKLVDFPCGGQLTYVE